MPRETRATNAQLEQRVLTVYKLILSGASASDIFRYISDQGWNVTERQVENYIAKARDLFKAAAKTRRDVELGKALARREDLYKRALGLADIGKALSADQDRCRLLNLYPKEEIEVSTKEGKGVLVLPAILDPKTYEAQVWGRTNKAPSNSPKKSPKKK